MQLLFVPELAAQQLGRVVRDLAQPLFQGLALLGIQAAVDGALRWPGGVFVRRLAGVVRVLWRGGGVFAGAGLGIALAAVAAVRLLAVAGRIGRQVGPALRRVFGGRRLLGLSWVAVPLTYR